MEVQIQLFRGVSVYLLARRKERKKGVLSSQSNGEINNLAEIMESQGWDIYVTALGARDATRWHKISVICKL